MRDTGPVSKIIDSNGDVEAAQALIGTARTVLGQLDNYMRFNHLAVGSRSVVLPDGSVMRAVIAHGVRRIEISAPTASGSGTNAQTLVPVTEMPVLSAPLPGGLLYVGEMDDEGTANQIGHPVRWSTRTNIVGVPYVADGFTGGCAAVSTDGSTIVGSVQGPTENYGFSARGNTITNIGGLSSQSDTYVSGVSGDGSKLSVWAREYNGVTGYLPHMWSQASGFVPLDNAGSTTGYAYCISPNGRYIGGMIYVGLGSIAALWDNGKLIRLAQNDNVWTSVYAVSDTGRACGTYNNAPVYWDTDGSMNYIAGAYPDSAAAFAITAAGDAIVGTLNSRSNVIGESNGTPKGLGASGSKAFIWTPQAGMQILGAGCEATAISPKGGIIGGAYTAPAFNNSHKVPVVWTRSGARTDLAVLSGTGGFLTSIGGLSA